MSVTFSLPHGFEATTRAEREAVYALPCPECGGHNPYGPPNPVTASNDCGTCFGHGGDTDAETAFYARETDVDCGFNVANGNAAYIVQDLLNLPDEEVYDGSIEPHMVLMRLAVAGAFAQNGVREPSESRGVILTPEGVSDGCRVIDGGRSLEAVESYIVRLRRLAEVAIERGAPSIVWG